MFIPDTTVALSIGSQVFYSRRSEGPYYRWSYEHTLQQWRSVRVLADELPYLSLSVSRWKNVPRSLQRTLVEHYVE
jgi:hypothetical protein